MCKHYKFGHFEGWFQMDWYGRPKPEDRINRKPKDRKK